MRFSDAQSDRRAASAANLLPFESLTARFADASLHRHIGPRPALVSEFSCRHKRKASAALPTRATADVPETHTPVLRLPLSEAPPQSFPLHPSMVTIRPSHRQANRACQSKCFLRTRSSDGPVLSPDDSPTPSSAGARIPAHRKTTDPASFATSTAQPAAPGSPGNSSIPVHTETPAVPLHTFVRALPAPDTYKPRPLRSPDSPPAAPPICFAWPSTPANPSTQTPHPVPPPFESLPNGLLPPIFHATLPGFFAPPRCSRSICASSAISFACHPSAHRIMPYGRSLTRASGFVLQP